MSDGTMRTLLVEATERKRNSHHKMNVAKTAEAFDTAHQEFVEACEDLKILQENKRALERSKNL